MNRDALTNRRTLAVAAAVLVLAVVVIGGVVLLGSGGAERGEPTPSQANSDLYGQLAGAGFQDAVVDVNEERAFVRYNVPRNVSVEATELFVSRTAARSAPDTDRIVLEVYQGFEPVERVVVATEDVLALVRGDLTYQELRNRMDVEPLT